MDMSGPRVLFLGLGQTAVAYYRCVLPALFLRRAGMPADWVCVSGEPPKLIYDAGMIDYKTALPDMPSYDVIVVQQPRGQQWLHQIRRWQDRGQVVLFEVDDYLHGIRKMPDHDFAKHFTKDDLAELELNMRVCDGIVCSTDFIARRYRRYNRHTFVCENGLDLARYYLTVPPRSKVNIGWAGGTGHRNAAVPWLQQLANVMAAVPEVCAVTIGMNYADALAQMFGPSRAVSVPWTLIDTYPAAMTLMDIALAPAGKVDFFKGKSDLRWLEAGALGIPAIVDPTVYWRVEDGVTGCVADTPEQAAEWMLRLVQDPELRREIGANAQRYVREERNMIVMAEQWRHVLCEAVASKEGRDGEAQDTPEVEQEEAQAEAG